MSTQSDVMQDEPWIPTTDTFGARLALLRQNIGWPTIKEAALACGLNRQSWKNWEAGKGVSSMDQVSEKIAARTNVDHYWLVTGKSGAGGSKAHIPAYLQDELPLALAS